jgi:3-hydroxy acid dehydrogenase / malonic semialdehyde reductase
MTPYRTALVTGASRGIGAAIVRRLRGLGLAVHALARDAAALKALAAETGCVPLTGDVTATEAVLAAVSGVEIDVLVNNAGAVPAVAPLHKQSAAVVDAAIDLNLRAPLHLMRALLPGMIARGRGHVVNIGSTAGTAVFAGTGPYAAAKAGLAMAGRVARYDLAGSNVRLTEIQPGRVETQVYLQAYGGDAARLHETMYAHHRALQPEDVAEAVALVLTLPERADVSVLELSPTDQAVGGHVYPSSERARG